MLAVRSRTICQVVLSLIDAWKSAQFHAFKAKESRNRGPYRDWRLEVFCSPRVTIITTSF